MPEISPNLAMPYIAPSQAQKHVTHNEALRLIDVAVQLSVQSMSEVTPPTSPAIGDRYIVASGSSGVWAGHSQELAFFEETGWSFVFPKLGWIAYVLDAQSSAVFDDPNWVSVPTNLSASDLQNLQGIGINSTYDSTNKLSVAADATLFNHNGVGHQLKLNKNSNSDTASLLFQSNWIGKAELGLAGENDFSLKVSDDGSIWFNAVQIDRTSGRVSFPGGGIREMLAGDQTLYVDPVLGSDANTGLSSGAGAFETIQKAVDVALGVDAAGHNITIQLADATYALATDVSIDRPVTGGGNLTFKGNAAAVGNVVLNATATAIKISGGARVSLLDTTLLTGSLTDPVIAASDNVTIGLGNLDFGTGGSAHISLATAHCRIESGYTISDDAECHLLMADCSTFQSSGQTIDLTGTPEFATSFVLAQACSVADFSSAGFTGAATGARYDVSLNSVVNTAGGGGSFLPGDIAGTTNTGGEYA